MEQWAFTWRITQNLVPNCTFRLNHVWYDQWSFNNINMTIRFVIRAEAQTCCRRNAHFSYIGREYIWRLTTWILIKRTISARQRSVCAVYVMPLRLHNNVFRWSYIWRVNKIPREEKAWHESISKNNESVYDIQYMRLVLVKARGQGELNVSSVNNISIMK